MLVHRKIDTFQAVVFELDITYPKDASVSTFDGFLFVLCQTSSVRSSYYMEKTTISLGACRYITNVPSMAAFVKIQFV